MGGIVKAVKKIVKSVVKAVVSVVKAVVNFVGDVIGFVINPFGAFDTPSVPDPGAEAQGVTVTKSGTNISIPVVYGYRRVGGAIIFAESNGTSNKYLYVVYAICEGEIEGVHKVIVNDVELPTQGAKHGDGTIYTVGSGRFKDRIKYQIFNGRDNQPQSGLANETPTWPKKQRKLPGIAYAVMRFEWKEIKTQEDADNNPFSGGVPSVKFDVYGKKVYDIRTHTDGTPIIAYSGQSRGYSFNPASCLLDYMMNPRYGAGIGYEQLDGTSFRIAAEKYEQTVNYSNKQSGRALTLNGVINTGNKVLDNIKTLAAGARGIVPFVAGKYKLKVEDGGHPTDITSTTVTSAYDVDKDNIVGGITLEGERKNSKYNEVIVNYVDPDKEFTNQQVTYSVAGDQTADNEEPLIGEFTFHTVTNKAIAYDIAQMIYDKSRAQRQISFTATQELLDVEVGDIIRITDTVLDLTTQTFRVVGMKLRNDQNVDIDAVEHDATMYPFTTGAQVELPANLYLPDDYIIIPTPKPGPQEPVGIVPPLDPDFDSAGEPQEVNPPGAPIDEVVTVTGITAFEDFSKTYVPLRTWQGTMADGKVYYLGYHIPTEDFLGFEAAGNTSLAQWTNGAATSGAALYTNQPHYGLARELAPLGSGRYYMQLIMPLDTRIDTLVIRSWYQNNLQVELEYAVRDPNAGAGVTIDPATGRYTRIDPYTNELHIPKPIEIRMDQLATDAPVEFEVRWKNKRTGEEWRDESDFTNVSFSNYSYTLNGSNYTTGNLEAFINYIKDYHRTAATSSTTSASKTYTAPLG